MYDSNLGGTETPGLEDYLRAVRNRKWLVLFLTLAGIGLSVLYVQSRTDSFDASARVRLAATPVGSLDNRLREPTEEEESAVFASLATANVVKEDLNIEEGPNLVLRDLGVQFQPDSNVLVATYTSTDAEEARDRVQAFAEAYTSVRVGEADNYYDTKLNVVASQQAPIQAQIDSIQEEININNFARAEANALPNGPERNQLLSELAQARATLLQDRSRLINQLNQLTAEAGDINQERAIQVPPATVLGIDPVPASPNGLSVNLLYVVGTFLGLISGILGAFILDRLDTSARGSADIELASGASVLGSVPQFGLSYRSGPSALVMLNSGKSTSLQRSREAYRRLRTSVQYLATTRDISTLLITSAQPGEGKSVTAANLAIALAQGGTSVALVSADMRRPTIENLFGIRNNDGLSVALRAPESTNLPVVSVGVENLAIVPSGPAPERPGELLGSERFKSLVKQLDATYDVVIIDTPPVLAAADAGSASSAVEGVMLLVDPGKTDTELLLQVRSELDRIGANVVGSIMNREKARSGRLFGRYDYSYEKAAART